jgi:hypothetical protein
VSADPLGHIASLLESSLPRMIRLLEAATDRIEELERREAELTEDVASLGTTAALEARLRLSADKLITEQVAELDQRLTSVHKQALRSLNLVPQGDEPA